ncbi:hypothetical protein BGZ65_001637 [Modicella reniformis]|uniref:Enoyl reductase (ER) domain-containing protein n=1 Tax=Modicella reniformis TaxID=1440133 RepID=A0A9P6LT05_9FUNG|nr:hypothetical protein BGZ65_001637 [Modicella reniformis]
MARISNTRIIRAKGVGKGEDFSEENFKTETVEFDSTLKDGEILVRNLYISLDPFIRLGFEGQDPKTSPYLNQTVAAVGISEVIDSKDLAFPVSSIVLGLRIGWEQYTLLKDSNALFVLPYDPKKGDLNKLPLMEYSNALGIQGLTSFAAVKATIGSFKKDQVVFISSAAGPVGGFFALYAKHQGAFVIGSAGSDDKVQYLLNDLHLDAAFNYKTQDMRTELQRLAPSGRLDVYVDTVGGETLDIAMEHLKDKSHILVIGNMAEANSKTPYVPKNWKMVISKSLTLHGFTAFHHFDKFPQLWEEIGPLIESGKWKSQKNTVEEGLESAPKTFVDYLRGKYHGKVMIKVSDL